MRKDSRYNGGGAEGTYADGSGGATAGRSDSKGDARIDVPTRPEKGATDMDVAYRTIMSLRSKLQGYENPAGDALSVEGHVEILLQNATDAKRLCKLYSGWAAWL